MPGMGGGWGNAWDGQYVHNGNGAIMCTPYQMPQYYWLVSPFFNISSSSDLRFWLNYLCTPDNPTELHVMIKTNFGWQLLQSFDSPAHTNVYASEISIPLGDHYGQNARIAFVYRCQSQANIVAIDDLSNSRGTQVPIPANVRIEHIGGQIRLSWDSAEANEQYGVFQAGSPTGNWVQVSDGTGFSRIGDRMYWSIPAQDKSFFMVRRYLP